MPNIDASIPLSYKPADMLSTLGSIASTAGAITSAKRGMVGLEQETGALDARKAVGAVVSDPQYQTPDGLFDLNKATPAIIQADPKNYVASEIITKLGAANNQLITVKRSALGLAGESRALIGSTLGAFANRDNLTKQELTTALSILGQQAPDAKPIIDSWGAHLAQAPDDPAQLRQAVMLARSQIMPPSAQIESQTPSGPMLSSGQVTAMGNVRPTAGPTGPVPGTEVQQVLPPGTQRYNPATQQMEFVGSSGPANLQTPRAPSAAPAPGVARVTLPQGTGRGGGIAAAPPLGTEQNVASTVAAVGKDWQETQDRAGSASQNIGILQNIKQFAPGAVTGVAQDRRAYIAGLAGLLHMDPGEMAKTETDKLAKNSAMLSLAGGNTDLAKVLAESANPNVHMTKEAIKDAADQVIAQQKLALAKHEYMQHFKGDQKQYSEELVTFNKVADPRILQYPEMTREQKIQMKAAMSQSEQDEFGRKLAKARAMGILK